MLPQVGYIQLKLIAIDLFMSMISHSVMVYNTIQYKTKALYSPYILNILVFVQLSVHT